MNAKKKKKLLVGGGVVAATAALFVGLASSGAIDVNNRGVTPAATPIIPGVKNATPVAETEEEKTYREQAFTYVPSDAMLVAQVNTADMAEDNLNTWWDWYRKMSPHPQSLPADLNVADGLQNVVLSYYPSDDEAYSELYMFDYNYVLTFDTVENRDAAISELHEVTRRSEAEGTSGAAELRIVDNDDAALLVYAPVSAFEEVETFEKESQKAKEEGTSVSSLVDQIPVMKEDAPTLYMNPDAFLQSYTQRSDDAGGLYASFGQAIRESVFGAKEGQESPIWIGTSEDFGNTWVSLGDPEENYKTYSEIEPAKIQEVSDRVFSEIMGRVVEEQMAANGYPGYAYGGLEFDLDEGLKSSVSIKSPKNTEVYGKATSIYQGGTDVTAKPESPEEFVFVFSPRSFHNWYVATGIYTQVSTVTLRSTPEKSTIEFAFDDLAKQ